MYSFSASHNISFKTVLIPNDLQLLYHVIAANSFTAIDASGAIPIYG